MNVVVTHNPHSPVAPQTDPHPWRVTCVDHQYGPSQPFHFWVWAMSGSEAATAASAHRPAPRYEIVETLADPKAYPWQCVNAPKEKANG